MKIGKNGQLQLVSKSTHIEANVLFIDNTFTQKDHFLVAEDLIPEALSLTICRVFARGSDECGARLQSEIAAFAQK